jgi:hypothetical protein
VYRRPSQETFTEKSSAHSLIGDVKDSERYIAVAPYGADCGGLGLTLPALVKALRNLRTSVEDGTWAFPPAINWSEDLTTEQGVLRVSEQAGVRWAAGTDGSAAVRWRLHNDRPGPDAMRGDVGLFATLQQLYVALKFGFALQERVLASAGPTLWSFRVHLSLVQPRHLFWDAPQAIGPVDAGWARSNPSYGKPITIAGWISRDASLFTLGRLLDKVAIEVAVRFGVEDQVERVRPGSRITAPRAR